MNKTLLKNVWLSLALFFFTGTQAIRAQCPNLVWSDEFSGTTLDLNNWSYQIGDGCAEGICGWGNNELQSYQEGNVTVSNGTLKITAQKERIRGSKYTSGRINSKNKADFTYGRFEASIKLPYGDGLWPAFWMLSTNEPYGGWPQSGEIDIMEFVASNPNDVLGYIHYGDPYPNNQSQGNHYTLANANFPDAFHEFALEWEPGEIRWFVDGVLFSVKKTADLTPYQWPFDHDFHFLLNVAVGGNLGGPVNDNMLPATMEVDYVRVYDGYRAYLSGANVVSNQAQGVTYTVNNLSGSVNVNWSVPADATIVSGQGTNEIIVNFGDQSGEVTATFNDGCQNQVQTIFVDVEQPYIRSFAFENFDDPATAIFNSSTGTLTEVSNPAPNAVNGSALSGEYVRNSGEQYDVMVYDVSNIADASDYVTKNKKFYMDVYTAAPVGTQILLQLETSTASPTNYPTGRHSRYVATITENSNWHRLVFSLLDQPDVTAPDTDVSSMVILFASNSFTGDTYYFDNLDSYSVDDGSGGNQSPAVGITSPSDGSTFDEGTVITISADASDADGSITQVEFFVDGSSIGVDASSPYTMDWTVASGTSTLTTAATDDGNATTTSSAVSVTGQATGTATSVHVASILTGTASAGQGNKYGTATIVIEDDLGAPVAGAVVSGTFSGTFNESGSGTTNTNGTVTIQTQATAKGGVTVDFCVDDVVAALPYDPAGNVQTCSNAGARTQLPSQFGQLTPVRFNIFPNPAKDILHFTLPNQLEPENIEIFSSSGTIVFQRYLNETSGTIDISRLSPGIYLVKVSDTTGKTFLRKLVK